MELFFGLKDIVFGNDSYGIIWLAVENDLCAVFPGIRLCYRIFDLAFAIMSEKAEHKNTRQAKRIGLLNPDITISSKYVVFLLQ